MKIQNKLVYSIFSFFALVIVMITIFSYQSFSGSSIESNLKKLEISCEAINKAVDEKLDNYFNSLEFASKLYNITSGLSEEEILKYRISLLDELRKQTDIKDSYYALADGRTFTAINNGQLPNFNAKSLGREWFLRIFDGEKRIVTTPYISAQGESIMAVGVPIYLNNLVSGAMCINLPLTTITNFTKSVLDFDNVYLTRNDGFLMASKEEDSIGKNLWEINPELKSLNEIDNLTSFSFMINGEEFEGYTTEIKALGWKVWTYEKKSIILKDSITNLLTNIAVIVIALILSIIIVKILIKKLIFQPLEIVDSSISSMEKGDLSNRNFGKINNDEIGDLLLSMKNMVQKLQEVVSEVRDTSERVARGSRELTKGNEDLSTRTEMQASALEETSAAIEEMNASIRSNADNTHVANQLSHDVSAKAEEGANAVHQMIASMNEISSFSSRISEIIDVINNLAFQTNLLALNASIEAARAGEQGKGFAVVAVEVRKLAKKSDRAASEIAEIIKTSNYKVSEGVSIADEAGKMLYEINQAVKKVTTIIGEISQSSNEQLLSADQIDKTLSSLDENTQKNASLAEEAAESTAHLSSQAVELNSSMKFFKLDDENIDIVKCLESR